MAIQKMGDRQFMEMAIDEMRKSEGTTKVGAVLVKRGEVVATGHKTVGPDGKHAERNAIEAARNRGVKLGGATLYCTLEPCVENRPDQAIPSCSSLIVSVGIKKVFIGRYDPNPLIQRMGWKHLNAAGIDLKDFEEDLRDQIDQENLTFTSYFAKGVGPEGGGKVNHEHGAAYTIRLSVDDERAVEIRWGLCGKDSAYARPSPSLPHVAPASFATRFDDVDDPGAMMPFKNGDVKIKSGGIAVFRGDDAFVLVKLKKSRERARLRGYKLPRVFRLSSSIAKASAVRERLARPEPLSKWCL